MIASRPSAAALCFRVALYLYPPQFRREFGAEMAGDFERASIEAWQAAQWAGLLELWAATASDLLRTVPVQWWRSGVPAIALLAVLPATAVSLAAARLQPSALPYSSIPPADRELVLLLLLFAVVLLVIIATIVFTLWFTRPLLFRDRG